MSWSETKEDRGPTDSALPLLRARKVSPRAKGRIDRQSSKSQGECRVLQQPDQFVTISFARGNLFALNYHHSNATVDRIGSPKNRSILKNFAGQTRNPSFSLIIRIYRAPDIISLIHD
jgi:hypothetical protein